MAYYEDLRVLQNNLLKCLLCDEVLENSDKQIELHLHCKKHRENYMKRLMYRNSITIQNKTLFCNICSSKVDIAGLSDHVDGLCHCKNLLYIKDALEKDGQFLEISESKNCIDCFICNCEIDFTRSSVESHLKLMKHLRAKAMVLQPLNGIFSVEDDDDILWCKICQRYFDNCIELIIQHVQEKEHSEFVRKIFRIINGHNIIIDNYLQCPKQDKAYCKKCDIEVSCNVDNLNRHIDGKKHKNNASK